MLPLVYNIRLFRNEQGTWLAVFGDISGQPAPELRAALLSLADKLAMHVELVEVLPAIFHRLRRCADPPPGGSEAISPEATP